MTVNTTTQLLTRPERHRAERLEAGARQAWRRAARPRHRRWMK
jgi:hypothetical protein